MTSTKHIAILGGGRLGTAFASLLGGAHNAVTLWETRADARPALKKQLPKVSITSSIEEAVVGADVVFFAIPAPAIREVAALYGPFARGHHIVVHAARGVGAGFMLAHDAIRAESCVRFIGAIGGPLHFRDVSAARPLVAILASRFDHVHRTVREIAGVAPIRLHRTADLVGVEVASAISNVSALAAGIVDGLELGEMARGVVLTHGLAEAAKLGVALGADVATFHGLAGVGDLIPRKVSSTERHHDVGARLARGESLATLIETAGGIVEGLTTASAAASRAQQLGLRLPLVSAVDQVVRGQGNVRELFEKLLMLDIQLGTDILAA